MLEKQDIELMKYFADDENTKYEEVLLNTFLEEKNAFGYVAQDHPESCCFSDAGISTEQTRFSAFGLNVVSCF